jgi:hypothetical protein
VRITTRESHNFLQSDFAEAGLKMFPIPDFMFKTAEISAHGDFSEMPYMTIIRSFRAIFSTLGPPGVNRIWNTEIYRQVDIMRLMLKDS